MATVKRDEQYKVRVYVARNGESYTFEAKIEFAYNPDDYGNGYSMGIESKEEPFGLQGYDLRYDSEFDPNYLIEYIVRFYSRRYDGRKTEYDTKLKLMGIRVFEAEFD